LMRALRAVKYFKALWKLLYGLMSSLGTVVSTVALLCLTLYIAACLAVELISKDTVLRNHADTREIIDASFDSVMTVMMVFLQFVTMDSIASIYMPLVKRRAYLAAYFVFLIVIVSIALMNLVTVVLIESAIASAKSDKATERRKLRRLRPHISTAFTKIDVDSNGVLSREEVLKCHADLPPQLLKVVPKQSLAELFDILDLDNSEGITQSEFVEGVTQLVLSDVPFSSLQEIRLLKQIRKAQEDAKTELLCIHSRLKQFISPEWVPTPVSTQMRAVPSPLDYLE